MVKRPPRLRKSKDGKYFIMLNGKKKYITTNIKDNKKLANIIINNYLTTQRVQRKQKGKKEQKQPNIPIPSENLLKYTLLNKKDEENIKGSKELQSLVNQVKDLEDKLLIKEKFKKMEEEKEEIQQGKPVSMDEIRNEVQKKAENKEEESIIIKHLSSWIESYKDRFKKHPSIYKIKNEIDDFNKEMKGSGLISEGLKTSEIEGMCKSLPNFNCIANDGLKDIKPNDIMNIIINTDNLGSKNDNGHWQAIFIDAKKDKSIDFYDSFGDDPSKQVLKDLKHLANKINPEEYLKLKINKVVEQDNNTATCGFHCINFLVKRNSGIPFMKATKYEDPNHVKNSEDKIKSLANKFGYI